MDDFKIRKKLEKNRCLINKALEIQDIELVYFTVNRLKRQNEKLIASLNKLK